MMKFAEGLGGDKQLLLRLGGWMDKDASADENPYDPSREIVGFIDPEDFYVAAQDNGMSQEDARKLLARLEEIRKAKARRQGREE